MILEEASQEEKNEMDSDRSPLDGENYSYQRHNQSVDRRNNSSRDAIAPPRNLSNNDGANNSAPYLSDSQLSINTHNKQ